MNLNGHLSIEDSTLTSYQKGSYLHIKMPIIEKNHRWQRKAVLQPVNTIAINVHIIKMRPHALTNTLSQEPLPQGVTKFAIWLIFPWSPISYPY